MVTLCSVISLPISGQNAVPAEDGRPPVGVDRILTELRMIRLELLWQRMEAHEQRIADLSRELNLVISPNEQTDLEEESLRLQVAELDERIDSSRATEDRAALQQARAQTIGAGAERQRIRQQDRVQRERAIRERLTQAQQTRDYLRGAISHLQAEVSRSGHP
jgi:Skp family chaperone for outer membrane proteins